MFENDLIPIICAVVLGGAAEIPLHYELDDGRHSVRADCITQDHAVEIGLDGRRSAYDSLHQALFYASLTDRAPMVVMVDTDGVEDNAQFQVETTARAMGVEFRVYDIDYLIRLQMTAPFRQRRVEIGLTQ